MSGEKGVGPLVDVLAELGHPRRPPPTPGYSSRGRRNHLQNLRRLRGHQPDERWAGSCELSRKPATGSGAWDGTATERRDGPGTGRDEKSPWRPEYAAICPRITGPLQTFALTRLLFQTKKHP
jgi:hypothetical protein